MLRSLTVAQELQQQHQELQALPRSLQTCLCMSHVVSCCQAKYDKCLKTLDDLNGERWAARFEQAFFWLERWALLFEVQVGKRNLNPWNKLVHSSDIFLLQVAVSRTLCLCWFGKWFLEFWVCFFGRLAVLNVSLSLCQQAANCEEKQTRQTGWGGYKDRKL